MKKMVSQATIARYRSLVNRIGFEQAQAIADIPNERWREIKEELRAIGLNPSSKASVLAQKRLLTVVVHEIQQEQPTRAEIHEIAETAWAEELTRLREENERLRRQLDEERRRREEIEEEFDELRKEMQQLRDLVNRQAQQPQQQQQPITYDEELEGLEEEPEMLDLPDFPSLSTTAIEQKQFGPNTITIARRKDSRIDEIYRDINRNIDNAKRIGLKIHFRDQNGSEFTRWIEYDIYDEEQIERDIETGRNRYQGSFFVGISVWAIQ